MLLSLCSISRCFPMPGLQLGRKNENQVLRYDKSTNTSTVIRNRGYFPFATVSA